MNELDKMINDLDTERNFSFSFLFSNLFQDTYTSMTSTDIGICKHDDKEGGGESNYDD